MKVLPFKIPKLADYGLVYQEDHEQVFYNQLHQHEDLQISYIHQGSGTLLLADSITPYNAGDVFVIGSHVPHVFKSDMPSESKSVMLSLFFDEQSFGAEFFNLQETKILQALFKNSLSGIQVLSDLKEVRTVFSKLKQNSPLERLISLLQILNLVSKADCKLLRASPIETPLSNREGQRLRDVFDYTMTNYARDISLDAIAEVAHMTKTAFCKYFKKRTNTTYNQFLNEYRIEMLIKAMQSQPDVSISQLAFDCGFGSISNFNKTFRAIKGCSPSQFQRQVFHIE